MNTNAIRLLSDERLLRDTESAAANERGAMAHVIALLGEIDVRRLYLQQGYSSMFVYCTRCLCLSEHAAYGRIEAARAARKFPIVLDRLADGSVTLTTICLLSNHLTAGNSQALLDAAAHKSRREVEKQVAANSSVGRCAFAGAQASGIESINASPSAQYDPGKASGRERLDSAGRPARTDAITGQTADRPAARSGTIQSTVHDRSRHSPEAS